MAAATMAALLSILLINSCVRGSALGGTQAKVLKKIAEKNLHALR